MSDERTTPMSAEALAVWRSRVQDTFQLDPTVIITLKSKQYKLEMNNFAAKELHKATGFNVLKDTITRAHLGDLDFLGEILFQLLRTEQPDITRDEVDKLFTVRHSPYIIDRVQTAIQQFLPDMTDFEPTHRKDDKGADPTQRPATTG